MCKELNRETVEPPVKEFKDKPTESGYLACLPKRQFLLWLYHWLFISSFSNDKRIRPKVMLRGKETFQLCRRPEFRSQNPHWAAHNCLSLQLRQSHALFWPSALMQQTHVQTYTHTYNLKIKQNLPRKGWDTYKLKATKSSCSPHSTLRPDCSIYKSWPKMSKYRKYIKIYYFKW